MATAKPRNDAYTGLLAISFLALVAASVLMYLDAEELGKAPEKGALTINVPGASGASKSDGLKGPPVAPAGGEPKSTSKLEPAKLPTIPDLDLPDVVVPVSATTTSK